MSNSDPTPDTATEVVADDDGSEGVDEQFRALMEGLRTTIPGVTVLFGFLLALPFQSDFSTIDPVVRFTYGVAFVATAVAAVLLIAPSAHQRVRALMSGIPRKTASHVATAVRLAVAGTASFLVAIVASVYLVTSVRFGNVGSAIALAVIGGLAAWAWFWIPLVRFQRD